MLRIALGAVGAFVILAAIGSAETSPIATPGEAVAVPSGQDVTFLETIVESTANGAIYRLRFLAPQIGDGAGRVGFGVASIDIVHLCEDWALPRLAARTPRPAEIVISLSDRAIPFGTTAPEATQFFDAFTPGDDGCVWQAY